MPEHRVGTQEEFDAARAALLEAGFKTAELHPIGEGGRYIARVIEARC